MASYVVMEPPRGEDRDARLVRDGFHFFAFLLPVIWLLWHRLWIEALLALAATLVLAGLGTYAGLAGATPGLTFLVSMYVGLEGSALRLAALRRRGWREWGAVEAANRDDAEARYLAEDTPDEPPRHERPGRSDPVPSAFPTAPRPAPSTAALGMLSYPGRR